MAHRDSPSPGHLDDLPESDPCAAELPGLDPTPMGWRHRDFYLNPGRTAHTAIATEIDRLSTYLGNRRFTVAYRNPLERALSA